MFIRILPPHLINQIAAGEVVERPASVLKELMENALDAGASILDVVVEGGGKSLLAVTDNGCGILKEEIPLALTRHATSKLPSDDLFEINFFGFRGEALPAIASVSRFRVLSNTGVEAWEMMMDRSVPGPLKPTSHPVGTRVEVRDLFYATPARLKFLKSDRAEMGHIVDVFERLAMAYPAVSFTLWEGAKRKAYFPLPLESDLKEKMLVRLGDVLGRDFVSNSVPVDLEREGIRLWGFASIPTFHRRNTLGEYLFVNRRPVRDKLLLGAIKGAYQDFMAHDIYPVVALFIDLPSTEVDVNVHPAKTEVRFKNPGLMRALLVTGIKQALAQAGHRATTTGGVAAVGKFQVPGWARNPKGPILESWFYRTAPDLKMSEKILGTASLYEHGFEAPPQANPGTVHGEEDSFLGGLAGAQSFPLGAARGQLHQTYIVSQTTDGLVIVDQHAAHERLVYERLKEEQTQGGVARQLLLIPEVVPLSPRLLQGLLDQREALETFGLVIEPFGEGAVLVRETPALLKISDLKKLIKDLAEEVLEWESVQTLEKRLSHVSATFACHTAIRAGQSLTVAEMNALLRQMEATPHSGQCNHGRPTYVALSLNDIERLFGRKE